MEIAEQVVERIISLCEERKISYYELSYRAAVPMSTLNHILSCSTGNPGIFTINRISDGLGLHMADFLDPCPMPRS